MGFWIFLLKYLPERLYINECLNQDIEAGGYTFLSALANVAKAQGYDSVSRKLKIARSNLYRVLSENGNPTLHTLLPILYALNMRVEVKPIGIKKRKLV